MGVLNAAINFMGDYKVKNNYEGHYLVPHYPIEIFQRDFKASAKIYAAMKPISTLKIDLFSMHKPYHSGYVLLHDAMLPLRGASNLVFGIYHCIRSFVSILISIARLSARSKSPIFIDKYRFVYGVATLGRRLLQLCLTPVFMPMNIFSRIAAQIHFHKSSTVVDNKIEEVEIKGTTMTLRRKFGVEREPLLESAEYDNGNINPLIISDEVSPIRNTGRLVSLKPF